MKYPGVSAADKYARDVVSGKIVACKWIQLACEKHLSELKLQKDKTHPFYFDSQAAERAIYFIEQLPHTKGKWAAKRELLHLQPWQKFFVANIFGWMKRISGFRKYRRAMLWVPRKNGKSILAAAIGNYMFMADGEYGAEIYSGATTEKQAWEVFRPAQRMVKKSPDLKEHFGIEVNASNMNIIEDNSKFEPVIGNPGDGSSPHCAICDEYHEMQDDRMVDTMETGMGAREQPLLLIITTAGDNISGPCFAMQIDAQKMLEGNLEDDSTFALLYTVDIGDDWRDISTMKKANPNYGVSINEDFLKTQLATAKVTARKQSTFKTKHLNVWVGSKEAYYNVQRWNDCASDFKIEDLYGKRAFIGMDLASRVDIAAVRVIVPNDEGGYWQFGKNYLPEKACEQEHYRAWMIDGWITVTDGEIIDFNEIKNDILDLCSLFEVAELGYDPFQATMLATDLINEGVPMVEMRPTVLNFSEPMKELDALIRDKRILHDGDPVMNWMMSNVTGKLDKKDNVYPNKDRPENKIDGPVALMMALGRAMADDVIDIDKAISQPLSLMQ